MKKLSLSERLDRVLEAYKSDPFRREPELKKLLKQAERTGDLYMIAKINLFLALCVFAQGRRGSMLSYAYKSVSIFENLNDHALLARSYNLLGVAYSGQGKYHRAIAAYEKALHLIRGKKNPGVRKESLLNNIGDSYYCMGAYRESLRLLLKCLSSCKRRNPENHKSIVLYGINCTDNYCGLRDFQKAKEILDEIQPDAECLEKCIILCGYYARRSYVLYAIGDLEGGTQCAEQVLDLVHSDFDSYEVHSLFEKIVSFQIEYGMIEIAQRFSDSLKKYAREDGHTLDLITSKRVQAKICCALGDEAQALALFRDLNPLYEKWMEQQKAMQYEGQKNVEDAAKQIVKLMQKIRTSDEKAKRDPLTGLLNRSAMLHITNDFYENAKKTGKKLGGVFIDIDYFKEYNDSYGHAAGDEAIKYIARVCLDEEKDTVRFFRYGGDEYFGVILGYGNSELEQLALRISENVHRSGFAHVKNPNGQRLTVTVGIVNVDLKETKNSVLDIIKYADKALYHAKNVGKDEVYAYDILENSEHAYRQVCAK